MRSETMRRGTPKITTKQWNQFLADLRAYGNASGASRRAGFDPKSARRRRKADSDFDEEWEDAVEEWRGSLMEAATIRARDGYAELVTCKDGLIEKMNDRGELVPVTQQRYSDGIMVAMLRGEFTRYKPQVPVTPKAEIPPELQPDEPEGDEPGPENPIL